MNDGINKAGIFAPFYVRKSGTFSPLDVGTLTALVTIMK